MVYSDQNKAEMAKTALAQFSAKAGALNRLYVPVFDAEFAQSRGDVEGAIASYRTAIKGLTGAKQYEVAGNILMRASELSVLLGQTASALSYAQQQKLDGEELPTVAFLQTLQANEVAAEQSRQKYFSARPWLSQAAQNLGRAHDAAWLAIEHGDGQGAESQMARLPNLQRSNILFLRGRAHLLTGDLAAAEADFKGTQSWDRNLENFRVMTLRVPVWSVLAEFYLGQVFEKQGKRDQAINEYQEFLSHFESSHTKLPQVEQARAAVTNLMK